MNHNTRTPATVPGPLVADAGSLPPTLDILTAAKWLGIGRTTAYRLAERDEFPTPVLRVGRCYRVPTAPLIALLGIRPEAGPEADLAG
ncbi:helix-turn-helix domain-containing protein [Actinospica robiniae]|uniref:helix-turn-helix domain-containing protein n=1 Tax=Actinospica robiniae TaxID=304901 RepID=UPI00041A5DC1|nr:helix-turn-helix domain-containing protein [Actinospica robiniae]